MNAKTETRTGFTFIEVMIVIGLTGFLMMTIMGIIQNFYRTNAYLLEETQAIDSARRSIAATMSDLREASYGSDGAYPVAAAATSTITFYANLDGDAAVEKIRYYLATTTLYRGVTDPAGNPPSYAGQSEVISLVVPDVRNGTSTPVFRYFNSSGAELTLPINIGSITSIRSTVLSDINPNRAPLVYTLMGSATLRNLRSPSNQ